MNGKHGAACGGRTYLLTESHSVMVVASSAWFSVKIAAASWHTTA
jgi:hypothetical protein